MEGFHFIRHNMCTGNFGSKLEFSFQVSDPESIQKPLIRPAYLRATWDKPQPTKPSQMNALIMITPTRLQNRKSKDAHSKKAKKWETWNSLHASAVSEVSGSLLPMPNWSLVEKQPTVDSQFSDLPNVHPLDQKNKKTRQSLSFHMFSHQIWQFGLYNHFSIHLRRQRRHWFDAGLAASTPKCQFSSHFATALYVTVFCATSTQVGLSGSKAKQTFSWDPLNRI